MKRYRFLVYSMLVAVLVYGIWASMSDGEKIALAINQVGISGLLFLCLLSITNYFLHNVRWYFMLRHLGCKPDFGNGLDASAAFVVALIYRVTTLWLSIFVGLLSILWFEYRPLRFSLNPQGNVE